MNDMRQETIDTYNRSAKKLAEYFRGIGSRVRDIDLAIELAGNPQKARVLEIGCGDGRDAKEIVRRTSNYVGFDISEELIKLARQHVPDSSFEVADAVTYQYPTELDVIFAFASLLHLDKSELAAVFYKAAEALRPGGIFYISTKYAPEFKEEIKEDQFGKRLFYFYNQQELQKLAGTNFETVHIHQTTIGSTDWIEIALRKHDESDD